MRFLVLTDFHNSFEKLPDILAKAGRVDGTLLAGDITHFGPTENARAVIGQLPRPVLAVPGNCDKRDLVDLLDEEDANLHERKVRYKGVTFIGIGGSNPTPFNTPFEYSEVQIQSIIGRLLRGVKGTCVLVSHAPPMGHVDEIPGGIHVGSTAVADMTAEFNAIVCGHIHEARGISNLGRTAIVNPGPASIGNAAILTIDDEGNASAELI